MADLVCSGWEGGKDIRFAIKTNDDKYLKPVKFKTKDGEERYKVVFDGGRRPCTFSDDMIELDSGKLVFHLPKFFVRAIA